MSLTETDNTYLKEQFRKKATLPPDTPEHRQLRDELFSYILPRLSDLLGAKKHEWYHKYRVADVDAESIYYDALLACVDKYDGIRCKFTTYFFRALHNHVLNFCAKRGRLKRVPAQICLSLDTGYLSEDDNTICVADQPHLELSLPSNLILQEECSDVTQELRAELSELEGVVFDGLLLGHSREELASQLSISKASISKIKKTIKQKLEK